MEMLLFEGRWRRRNLKHHLEGGGREREREGEGDFFQSRKIVTALLTRAFGANGAEESVSSGRRVSKNQFCRDDGDEGRKDLLLFLLHSSKLHKLSYSLCSQEKMS